jgi:DNA-binding IclR family transcriptional regulator
MRWIHAGTGNDLGDGTAMISSARRTMTVLETIARAGGAIGVTDIARHLGLQPGTVFRSLAALEQAGYIVRFQSSSRYVLGPAVNQLRQSLLARFKLRDVSLPYLRQLAFATGETVSLNMMVGWYSLRIGAAAGTNDVTSSPPIGEVHELDRTCAGQAMLAFLPEDRLQGYQQWASGLRGNAATRLLTKELRAARARGFSVEVAPFPPNRASIAFPIHGEAGPIAAIAIEGPVLQFDQPHTQSNTDQWTIIVRSLQQVVDGAPSEFAGPFRHIAPPCIRLTTASELANPLAPTILP